MYYLCSLGIRNHGFESHKKHGCLMCVCLFCVCVVLCLGRGLAMSWSPVQGVLPSVKMIMKLRNDPYSPKWEQEGAKKWKQREIYRFSSETKGQCGWFKDLQGLRGTGGFCVHALWTAKRGLWATDVYQAPEAWVFYLFVIYLTTISVTQNI
jgi:hypothetical protein